MKQFNITAQAYRLNDPHKQHLLINEIFIAESSKQAIFKFNELYSLNIEFHVVKIYSAEEFSQDAA